MLWSWNKDKECYYTNGLLKRLHNYDKTNSEESKKAQNNEEVEGPTVNQQIRQTPIDPTLCTSPLLTTTNTLPDDTATMSTQTITATTTMSTSAFRQAPMPQQKIAATMSKALQKGKSTGLPGGGGPPGGRGPSGSGGLPGGGAPGQPGGGGQPQAAQQPVQVAADMKAMGSLPQIFTGDRLKLDNFIKEVKGYFCLNADVVGYNSPYKKVAFTLTLIKGDEPAQWV